MTLIDLLKANAEKFPSKKAYVHLDSEGVEKESLTYGTLAEKLKIFEIEKSQRVLIIMPAGLEFIKTFFSVIASGAIPVVPHVPHPFFHKKSLRRMESIIQICSPKLILTTQENISFYQNAGVEKVLTLDELVGVSKNNTLKSNDTALIQFTSGTQKNPRGVVLTHHNLIQNLNAICVQTEQNENCKLVSWLPHSHDMGLIGGILVPFMCGGTSYLLGTDDFLKNPLSWMKAISINKATSTPSPMFGFDLCSHALMRSQDKNLILDLSSLKVAFNGAEPLNLKSVNFFYKNFAQFGFELESMYPCYGLAECTLMVSGSKKRRSIITLEVSRENLASGKVTLEKSENFSSFISCGSPVNGLEIFIVSADKKVLEELSVGEIWLRGPSIAAGYWNADDSENSAFDNDLSGHGNGFFRTNDLGFLYKGELYFVSRSDDVIVIRSEKFYPEEIEKSLTHLKTTDLNYNLAVIGADQDTQVLQIMIEADENLLSDKKMQLELEKNIMKEVGETYFLKSKIYFVSKGSFVKTTSGKLSRKRTKELLIE